MSKTFVSAASGLKIVLKINNQVINGQQTATLNQTSEIIDISNEITKTWKRIIVGKKNWNIIVKGMIIKNAEDFLTLQNAFQNKTLITVILTGEDQNYTGSAYITSFPLNAIYNETAGYNLTLTGTGPLE